MTEMLVGKLDRIINTIADPVFVKDRQHCWTLLNKAFCDMMGYAAKDLLGKSDYDFFPKKEADVFWSKDEVVFETGAENVNEEYFTDGSGVRRIIITKKTLYRDSTGKPFLVGIIRDITELRQTTEELKGAYEKLVMLQGRLGQSEKMASLGQLAAGIAHEINNPSAYILSNLETLKSYTDQIRAVMGAVALPVLQEAMVEAGQDDRFFETLRDMPNLMDETIEGILRIQKIVADLRIFSHPSGGSMEKGDLHECIDRALAILAGELKHKARVVREYGVVPAVSFRQPQMLQVFMNLLTNAAQSFETSGTITIRTWAQDRFVHIEVSDSGAGILPEHLGKVFDPFFTTKPVGQGTGLGLSVVHGIIAQHKGEITAHSELGEGTVFHIKLWRDGPDGAA